MGRASRAKREERVLRDVGVVYFDDNDGVEVELVGEEADALRALMTAHCPLCAGEDHRQE